MLPAGRRPYIATTDIVRAVLGWGVFAALLTGNSGLKPPVPAATLILTLLVIITVISVCAFGVVKQAEALAHRLGDPYGSLVLTLSIVLIEVILISAVMLGPGDHVTIARDSVMAVSMIILNLVIGVSLLVGGVRHGAMQHNRTGTSAYLSMLVVLTALAFGLPEVIGGTGSYSRSQSLGIAVLTLTTYAFFLYRQMGAQADDFREVDERLAGLANNEGNRQDDLQPTWPIGNQIRLHRQELTTRLAILVVTAFPILLLSHFMATLLDDGLERLGAPVALAGLLIAMIVFLPESLTSVRAALAGEVQRVSNLCHGALVSTVGLTIPAVLLLGLLTNQSVVLAESNTNLFMLIVTLGLSIATFGAQKVTAINGASHLLLFAIFGLALFS